MTPRALAALLTAGLCAAPWRAFGAGAAGAADTAAKEKAMAETTEEYRMEGGWFACRVPSAWGTYRDKDEDARTKVYGLTLIGKKTDGVPARIYVEYYAPGNTQFADAKAYLDRQAAPKVADLPWKALQARRFTRDSFDFVPPKSTKTRKVAVREEQTVIETDKGFFLVSVSAARPAFAKARGVYVRVLDSLEPFPSSK